MESQSAEFCRRCPRKYLLEGPATTFLNTRIFNMADAATRDLIRDGKKGQADSKYSRQFYGELGKTRGYSDDMPPNTTLEDIAECEQPEVIEQTGICGWRKTYECGAFLVAAARLNEEAEQSNDA